MNKVLIVVVAVLAALTVVVSRQPDTFQVTRSATINAAPAVVFAQVNDLLKWEAWSPWAKMDPKATSSYEGAPSGVGASMSWAGNRSVGQGKMTITNSHPSDLVELRLEFEKPMKGTNEAQFTFKPEGKQTVVTWSMQGKNNFIAKAVGLVMNCDKMVGGQFEQGLSQLKAVSESLRHK